MDISNHSYTVGDHNVTFSTGSSGIYAIIGPINVVFVTVSNSFLLATILSSVPLRRQMRVQLMVCMAIVDLIMGSFTTAMFSYSAIQKTWIFGCPIHHMLQIFGVFADIFLTSWYMILLNASYFFKLMDIRLPELSPLGEKLFRTTAFSFPVLLFCVICLPIIYTHPVEVKPSNEDFCPLFLEDPYEIAMSFVCFFIPATSLIVFVAVFIIFRKDTSLSRNSMARNLLEEPCMVERPLLFVVPSLGIVLCALPEQICSILFFSKTLVVPGKLFVVFSYFEFIRPGVLPFLWLVFPDIRQAFVNLMRKCKCKRADSPMTVTNFSYKNLQAN